MIRFTNMIRKRAAILAVAVVGLPVTQADAYPIDCAIFLCLAGGWPSSTECDAARAEFIRRITPYPVEPPLQLWRCPMGASTGGSSLTPMQRLNAIKATSENPSPELPAVKGSTPRIVDASYSSEFRTRIEPEQDAGWLPLRPCEITVG